MSNYGIPMKHGTVSMYQNGKCRCSLCTTARKEYDASRRKVA